MLSRIISCLCCCWAVLQAPLLQAHGSVTAEGDLCIIRIGFYTAHFKVFQPHNSGDTEFCEDLPVVGESLFVMDYVHQDLGKVPIEFRIIRDVTGFGRFARLEDLERIADLDAVTVFHQAPVTESAVFTVLHEFIEAGDYLGLVTVQHPQTGQVYAALFPFSVGFRGWGLVPLFILLALASQLTYWRLTGGYARWRARRGTLSHDGNARWAMLLAVVLAVPLQSRAQQDGQLSEQGWYRVRYASAELPVPLNRIHRWTLQLEDAAGDAVVDATLSVSGGMPAHQHGLPTAPAVTALGDGAYRLEGLRFHMPGAWLLTVSINHDGRRDSVLIPLNL